MNSLPLQGYTTATVLPPSRTYCDGSTPAYIGQTDTPHTCRACGRWAYPVPSITLLKRLPDFVPEASR